MGGEDETATGVSKYVQISQGGKLAATGIPWSLVTALQAVKVEVRRKPEVAGVKSPLTVICKVSYLPLIRFDLYPVGKREGRERRRE